MIKLHFSRILDELVHGFKVKLGLKKRDFLDYEEKLIERREAIKSDLENRVKETTEKKTSLETIEEKIE